MSRKYPMVIGSINALLLLVALSISFLGTSLVLFYKLDELSFVSGWYSTVPYLMIGTGISDFVVAFYGFVAASSGNRIQIIVYAILLIVLFGAQLVGIFASLELRSKIDGDILSNQEVYDSLEHYESDRTVKRTWDILHRQYHCCGGLNFNSGYKIWSNVVLHVPNSVPDSCCHIPTENCGRDKLLNPEIASQTIFVHGCLTVMQERLKNEVAPICLVSTAVGTIVALLLIINVVMSFALSASWSRKKRYQETEGTFGYPAPPTTRMTEGTFDRKYREYASPANEAGSRV